MIYELHRAAKLDIHITVDADQAAFVLCLTPLQADDDFFVDPVVMRLLAESWKRFGREDLGLIWFWGRTGFAAWAAG